MTDEAFTRLVSGIGSMVTQTAMGQPPSQPIADFLSSLGEDYGVADGSFSHFYVPATKWFGHIVLPMSVIPK
jgi:hypothetical protein